MGVPLERPAPDPDRLAVLEADLADARRDLDRDPHDESNIIWYGRRLAYLGRYNEALAVFEDGLRVHPESFRLMRHAGHRLITLRRFEAAIDRLSRAAELIEGLPDEVELDGAPNALNIPRSTTHFNIWYHLGLGHFLLGEYEDALEAYRKCIDVSKNDDSIVAATHWLWMTLRRLGRDDEAAAALAPIREDMEIIENWAYFRLCLLYAQAETPRFLIDPLEFNEPRLRGVWVSGWPKEDSEVATDPAFLFGVANFMMETGNRELGMELWSSLSARGPWPAFGTIGAEVEIRRHRSTAR